MTRLGGLRTGRATGWLLHPGGEGGRHGLRKGSHRLWNCRHGLDGRLGGLRIVSVRVFLEGALYGRPPIGYGRSRNTAVV